MKARSYAGYRPAPCHGLRAYPLPYLQGAVPLAHETCLARRSNRPNTKDEKWRVKEGTRPPCLMRDKRNSGGGVRARMGSGAWSVA